MNKNCQICGETVGIAYLSPIDDGPRCQGCARIEMSGLLEGLDADVLRQLRRRAEDALRKNPAVLLRVAIDLAVSDSIRWRDLISIPARLSRGT